MAPTARDTARVARADLMPTLNLDPSYERQRYSPNANPSFGNITANTWSTPLDLSYEIDLWGRVRRGFESARYDAQASLANYCSRFSRMWRKTTLPCVRWTPKS